MKVKAKIFSLRIIINMSIIGRNTISLTHRPHLLNLMTLIWVSNSLFNKDTSNSTIKDSPSSSINHLKKIKEGMSTTTTIASLRKSSTKCSKTTKILRICVKIAMSLRRTTMMSFISWEISNKKHKERALRKVHMKREEKKSPQWVNCIIKRWRLHMVITRLFLLQLMKQISCKSVKSTLKKMSRHINSKNNTLLKAPTKSKNLRENS